MKWGWVVRYFEVDHLPFAGFMIQYDQRWAANDSCYSVVIGFNYSDIKYIGLNFNISKRICLIL